MCHYRFAGTAGDAGNEHGGSEGRRGVMASPTTKPTQERQKPRRVVRPTIAKHRDRRRPPCGPTSPFGSFARRSDRLPLTPAPLLLGPQIARTKVAGLGRGPYSTNTGTPERIDELARLCSEAAGSTWQQRQPRR